MSNVAFQVVVFPSQTPNSLQEAVGCNELLVMSPPPRAVTAHWQGKKTTIHTEVQTDV